MSRLVPLSIFLLSLCQAAGAITCSSTTASLNRTTYTLGPGVLEQGQECTIVLDYPNGTYAQIDIAVQGMLPADTIQFFNAYSSSTPIALNGGAGAGQTLSFAIPPPSTRIYIKTGAGANLNINLTVNNYYFYPFATGLRDSQMVNQDQYETYFELSKMQTLTYYEARSMFNHAAIVLAIPSTPSTPTHLLSNAFLYDGNQAGATLLGTLYDFMHSGPLYAKSMSFSIYCAELIPMDGVVMATDRSNLNYFTSYQLIWAPSLPAELQTTNLISDNGGMAAVTLVSSPSGGNDGIYLTDVQGYSVQAYYHAPLSNVSAMVELQLYSQQNAPDLVPQHFEGYSRTFLIKGTGQAVLKWTTDASKVDQSRAFYGRGGFVATPMYPIRSGQINSEGISLKGENNQQFALDLTFVDCNENSTMQVKDLDSGCLTKVPCNRFYYRIPTRFFGRNIQVKVADTSSQSLGTWLLYSVLNVTTYPAPSCDPLPTPAPTTGNDGATDRTPTKKPGDNGSASLFGSQLFLLVVVALILRS